MAAGEKPHLMSFVSEKQLEDVRKKRQEEWEKNRKPGQAEEMPEVHDSRPLYERLREQKEKKQMEWDEQFKLKNMIYQGLDDEEAGFLNFVHQRQAELEERQYKEEIQQVKDYRDAVATLQASEPQPPPVSQQPTKHSPQTASGQKSQSRLLAGVVRAKRQKSKDGGHDAVPPIKKARPLISEPIQHGDFEEGETRSIAEEKETSKESAKEGDCSGTFPVTQSTTLPGLCVYSDSESEPSDE